MASRDLKSRNRGAIRAVAVAVILGIAIALYKSLLSNNSRPNHILFSSGSKFPSMPIKSILSESEVESYKRDGFILKRGLVTDPELCALQEKAEQIYSSFSEWDLLFKATYAKLSFQIWRFHSEYARLAFESTLPSIAAQLMEEKESVRILKDALFGYTAEGKGCGFHVDDKGFWPAEDDATGVTFWIALSSMTVKEGGGIRIANATHTSDWAKECRKVIASGFNATCKMSELSPSCDKKLQDVSVIYDMQPGDAIIWDRWIFHRSEPFHVESHAHKLRYSIRYIPSNAKAAPSLLLHQSVKPGEPFNSPYHPRVWPSALESEVKDIVSGIGTDVSLGSTVLRIILEQVKKTLGVTN